MATIQLKRGVKSALPTSGMLSGEPLVTIDRGTLHIAIDSTTKLPVVPAIEDLNTLAVVDSVTDMMIIHDSSELSGQKEKKITIANLKTAMNIPDGDTDEKVAVASGGTAGYIWGTDGTDGVIRMNSSLSWSKDASNAFVTISVNTVDGGTF
jgi:hypothetical protein